MCCNGRDLAIRSVLECVDSVVYYKFCIVDMLHASVPGKRLLVMPFNENLDVYGFYFQPTSVKAHLTTWRCEFFIWFN